MNSYGNNGVIHGGKGLKPLVIILLMVFPFLSTSAQENEAAWCVSVWYPSSDHPGGLDSMSDHGDLIHEVNPFWYTPLPDGTLSAEGEDMAQVAAWREAGFVIIPTIFSSFWNVIEAPLRNEHIANIVALVEEKDYDGIEIDYEGFAASTRDDFSIFIEQLAEKLHANNRLLAIAVHAKTDDSGSWEGAAAVDIFKSMTYDYTSRNEPPGPIAPPLWVKDVLDYAATVTDLSKVRVGLPFYGYSWQRGNPPARTIAWESTQNWITSFQQEIVRDPDIMEARIDLEGRGLPKQTVYMVDAAALEYKLAMIAESYPDLGGVAIRGIGGEDPANWDVLERFVSGSCDL